MKFLFSNRSTSPDDIHKNLFPVSADELDSDEDVYISDEENENKSVYSHQLEKNAKRFRLKQLSLPLTDTIAEFAQDLSDEEFFINDLSFILDMSRKRAISPYALIVALLYLKRLKSKQTPNNPNPDKCENSLNNYLSRTIVNPNDLTNAELCLISIILATKYLVDEGEAEEIYNYEWAECVDLSIKRLNTLEREFLARLNWDLFVSSDEFWQFTGDLAKRITWKKVKLQWNQCTYSDLDCLLSFSNDLSSLGPTLQHLGKILLVCSSTLVYLVVSTYFLTNAVMVMKNFLSSSPIMSVSVEHSVLSNSHHDQIHVGTQQPIESVISITRLTENFDENEKDVRVGKCGAKMLRQRLNHQNVNQTRLWPRQPDLANSSFDWGVPGVESRFENHLFGRLVKVF